MSPYTAGGRWVPAPGISYDAPTRPGENPRPIIRGERYTPPVAAPVTAHKLTTKPAGVDSAEWVPSTLTGSRILNVGGTRFRVPRSAQVKQSRRASTVWLHLEDGQTFILSELGELSQTETERRATRWDLL